MIIDCEGGSVEIRGEDSNKKTLVIETDIPESHWCERCKALDSRTQELKDRFERVNKAIKTNSKKVDDKS